MSRRTLGLGLIVLWLVAVGWLARRELWRPSADRLAEAALSLQPGAAYYAISVGGEQFGYASLTVDTLIDTLRVSDVVILDVPVSGGVQRTEARTDASLSRTLELRSFTAAVRGDGGRFDARGRVEGDSVFALQIGAEIGGETRRSRLTSPLLLRQLLPLTLTFAHRLATGEAFALRVFDPVLAEYRDVALTVAAESTFIVADSAVFDSSTRRFAPIDTDTVHAWQLRGTDGGIPLETWVDDDGLPVLTTSPNGLRIERTAFEVAYENFRRFGGGASGSAPDLVRTTAVAAGAPLPTTARPRLRVRLRGQPLTGFDLEGGRQRLEGDTLVVAREGEAQLQAEYRLPGAQPELLPFLRPAPLIPSDDPRILAQARQIIGRTGRPRRAAERLVEWVYQNVRKEAVSGGPSAVTVLESRRGDCNEHTVLFVALARSIGLPARTAAGLVSLDGAFYYHAWPEVYLNGWVAVDPTFGQFPADAAHVRLTIGGLARQLELLRLVGRLRVEILPTN